MTHFVRKPPLRNIEEFFTRWPMTEVWAQTQADVCAANEAQLRRMAQVYPEGHPRHCIAWDFAVMEFMAVHEFQSRANVIAGRVI